MIIKLCLTRKITIFLLSDCIAERNKTFYIENFYVLKAVFSKDDRSYAVKSFLATQFMDHFNFL